MSDTFGQIIESRARTRPDDLAISYPDGRLSWRELEEQSAARARRLIELGVKQDDMVAISLPNGVEHHLATFAAWRAGATPCILPTKLPGKELAEMVAVANPAVLIGENDAAGVTHMRPGETGSSDTDLPSDLAAKHYKAVASGGSTGKPKLIVDHNPARWGDNMELILQLLSMPRDGVMLNPGPLYHNAPFLFSNVALLAGSTVIGMTRFDAEAVLRNIDEHGIQWVCLVPTMMHRVWSLPEETRASYDLSSLRIMFHVAAACPPWLKRAWMDWIGPEKILELYGATECIATFITGPESLKKPGSVGRVRPDTLVILNEAGEECGVGEVGEIFFLPQASSKFHYKGADTIRDDDGRFSVGDMGYVDEDGYLFLSDRRTDLIIRGGANIYPAEVEAQLTSHPEIKEAVVLGLPCEEYGARVHAVVEADSGFDVGALDAFMRDRLARYKCPESYELASEPLRDEAGKVRRKAMLEARLQKN